MATQSPQTDSVSTSHLPRKRSGTGGAQAVSLTDFSLRILVVEDDVETATMIRRLLEYRGYEVVELHSGVKALDLITAIERGEQAPFDVALLDIMMPRVNGYQVCQAIRRTECLGYVPIIMVTALNSTADMVRGLDLGADDYLVKPFNSNELLARVRAALRIRDVDRVMRRRNWQLAVLNVFNDAIGESLDRGEVLRTGLGQLLQRLDLSYAVAFLRDRHTGGITQAWYHDGERWSKEQVVDPDEDSWRERGAYQLALDVVASGQRRWQAKTSGWPALPGGADAQQFWHACVPLRTKSPAGLEQALRQPPALQNGVQAEESSIEPPWASANLGGLGRTAVPPRWVLGALLVGAPADKPMIELDLLTAIGNQIGQALEKSRFYQQSRDRSEELVALLDGISDLIYVVDDEFHIVVFNAAMGRWLAERRDLSPAAGEGTESVVGQTCYQTLFERETPCESCQMAQALHSIEHRQWTECRRQASGAREEWEISAYPIQGSKTGPSQVIVLARDVTERRMLEESLSQSDKLAALGQLAAGLAHEINNPLTAIVANVQLLLMDTVPDDPNYESLGLIRQASDRAVRVVRNLLNFARQEQYEFRPTDLNVSLHAALELVRHQFLIAQVKVFEDLAPDLPFALASHDHLQGVWLNLLLNARDAVTQQARTGGGPGVWVSSRLRDDGLLEARVSDNGPGIPPEQLNRIFEPFFTTKDPGKGTGLGLSTSYYVIKQHGGEIQVDSEVGMGTTFSVLFPSMAS